MFEISAEGLFASAEGQAVFLPSGKGEVKENGVGRREVGLSISEGDQLKYNYNYQYYFSPIKPCFMTGLCSRFKKREGIPNYGDLSMFISFEFFLSLKTK